MTNPRATVLLCQPCDFQRWVWQRVLTCQNLAAIPAASAAKVLEILDEILSRGQPMPVLILIDQQTPDLQLEEFCHCCQEKNAQVPVILLESTNAEVTHYQRQAAIAHGAIDLLPPFEADTLALKVIAGIKKVLFALGGLTIHNDPLVSCLLALKQEMENAESLSTSAFGTSLPQQDTLEPPADSFPPSEPEQDSPHPMQPVPSGSNPEKSYSDKGRHKRVYRGRVY